MGESTNATIDSVVIEVESTAKDTANGLNSLITTLDKINSYISSSIKNLTSYNSELDTISNNINNSINKISSALSKANTGTIDLSYNNPQNFNSLLSTIPDSTIDLDLMNPEELEEIEATIDSINQELEEGLKGANEEFKNAKQGVKKLDEEAKKSKNLEKLKKTLFGFLSLRGISKVFDWMGISFSSAIQESTDYIENLNLLHVSLEENADAALKFSNNLQDVLGIDSSDTIRYISLFNTLAEGFGVASDKAYIMSKNLTQLTYDMSSYLNLSVEESMQKLKSGFSGEIEPMRAVGVALDQATLQQTAYKLGIDQTVSSMNRLQKTQLIYYQIMTSTTKMQGDMGRTLLQPANAIRVMKQQFTLLARAIGNIFIPIIMKVIPYVMVLTQWLTKAAQAIANFFGFKIDVNGWSNATGDISAGIEDIGDSANGTTKELKKMLAPFDELNVIDFGKDGSGSSGVSTGGELDVPLPEYDMLTNAISRNLDEVKEKLKEILPIVVAIGGSLLTWKIGSSVIKFLELIKGNTALRMLAGITILFSSVVLEWNGIQQVLKGNLGADAILSLLSGGLGAGAGTFLLTKNVKLALIVTAFVESFNIGLTIGEWLNQNYGDSYDWYLEKFNVNLSDGVDFSDVLGLIGTALGAIGDAVLDGLGKIWGKIPNNVKKGLETVGRVALATLTLGISEIIIFLAKKWDNISKFFGEDIPNFFTKTIPKWKDTLVNGVKEIGENIIEKIENTKTSLVEKEQEIKNNITNGISEVKNKIKDGLAKIGEKISNWWKEDVSPWFSFEKWGSLGDSIKNSLSGKWNEFTSWFSNNGLSSWWKKDVAPWFTWEKWKSLAQSAIDGIKEAFANLNIRIKLPHFTWTSTPAEGWIANILSALNLPTSLPKLNVSWYDSGGFPETGEAFIARENGPELVGRIGNKSAVINNSQIIEGVSQGVKDGVSEAMQNYSNKSGYTVVNIGDRKVYSGYGEYANEENNMYGTNVIRV